MKESEKIAETESVEVAQHSCYYYRATIIQKLLKGEDVDLGHCDNGHGYDYGDICVEVENKFAFDSALAGMMMERFLVLVDFVEDLNRRDYSFVDVFEKFFDIAPELAKFKASEALLAQVEALSPHDSQLIRLRLASCGKMDARFHDFMQFTLADNLSLSGVIKALVSAAGKNARYFLKFFNSYGKTKCRLIARYYLAAYAYLQRQQNLEEYNEWLSNYAPIDFEDGLSRRMGYYMDKLNRTDYLKPYRDSVGIWFDQKNEWFFYADNPYRYNFRGFLVSVPRDYCLADDFLWRKNELVDFIILRDNFHLLGMGRDMDETELGRLIIENRFNFSISNVLTLITCLKGYRKILPKLQDVIMSNDKVASNSLISDYSYYMLHKHIVIPERLKSKRASRVWAEFIDEKYLAGKSGRYVWIHTNSREFGYFVYYAHQFFCEQHAQDEIINWDAYCFLFSKDTARKNSYRTGCSEIARIEKSGDTKKLPETAKRIKKIFKRFR